MLEEIPGKICSLMIFYLEFLFTNAQISFEEQRKGFGPIGVQHVVMSEMYARKPVGGFYLPGKNCQL